MQKQELEVMNFYIPTDKDLILKIYKTLLKTTKGL